jgi:hypothetical protein
MEQQLEALATEILAKVDHLRPTLEKHCRFKPGIIIYKKKILLKSDEKQLTDLINWLIATKELYVDKLLLTWQLLREDQWEMYANLGIQGLTEQILLKDNVRLLRDRWRNRPRPTIAKSENKIHVKQTKQKSRYRRPRQTTASENKSKSNKET